MLGLAPFEGSLARLASKPVLKQMREMKAIQPTVWSVTLLDTESGFLSFGGTIAKEVERAKIRGDIELAHVGDPQATTEWVSEQVEARLKFSMPEEVSWDKHFKWTEVQGSKGWWTVLMRGVWINGAKVRPQNARACLTGADQPSRC
jgi:hypothetical protein